MNSPIGHRKYLVTGASGYVGGRLVRALVDEKDDVRILVRDKNKIMGQPWATQVDICEGSAENFADLQRALEGIHTAFYLLHSINLGPHFDEIESEMARNFAKAAELAGVSQIIYLGGIANVSYNKKGKRLAFDICPVNIVMNSLAEKLGAAYDKGGKFAASGKANKALLEQLNKVEFYSLKAPKSLGIEYIEENYFPLIKASKVSVEDKLCTMVEHIAMQIASNLQKGKVLVTGGGAKNSFLISRLKHHYKGEVVVPANEVIDFKEAIIFAFLGVLRTLNLSNCLSSVTGAKYDCSGGVIIEG